MAVRIFFDRYELQYQENRQRGKIVFKPWDWSSVLPLIEKNVGKAFRVRNGRVFAIGSVEKITLDGVEFACVHAGMVTNALPNGFKDGETGFAKMPLPRGYKLTHPAWFAFPTSGSKLILQFTRSGPHMKDIGSFFEGFLQYHWVDYTWSAPVKFIDGMKGIKKVVKAVFSLKAKKSGTYENYDQAAIGKTLDAGNLKIEASAEKGHKLSKTGVMSVVDQLLGYESSSDLPYEVDDITLWPAEEEHGAVIRLGSDARRFRDVPTHKGEPTNTGITEAIAQELAHWISKKN